MSRIGVLLLCSFLTIILFSSFNKRRIHTVVALNELSKEDLINLYKENYLASVTDTIVWNGSEKDCKAGYLSNEMLVKAEKRINFFRLAVGLPKIILNKEFNQLAQSVAHAALVNENLKHKIQKTDKCYTDEAAKGFEHASWEKIDFKDLPGTSWVTGFMQKCDAAAHVCEQRRWLLYTKAKEVGYGATHKTEAIYFNHLDQHPKINCKFMAYPWNGFIPVNLVSPTWTFSIPEGNKVDLSTAEIVVKDDHNKKMHVKMHHTEKHFLDHTIAWEMPDLYTEEEAKKMQNNLSKKGFVGRTITVTISNVLVNHEPKNFFYQVKIIEP